MRVVDRGYTALEAESALVQHSVPPTARIHLCFPGNIYGLENGPRILIG